MSQDDEHTRTAVESGLAADLNQPNAALLVYHRDGCQLVPLCEDQALVVGRSRPADVPIRDSSLSRQHARFKLEGGVVWVEDLQSTNGTRLNGKKIRARSKVKPGDAVQIGGVTIDCHIRSGGGEGLLPEHRLESHDRLMARLEEEVIRSRTFNRGFALLMVRSLEDGKTHVARWEPKVRALLRPVDGVSLYGPESVLICRVESRLPQALELAEGITRDRKRGEAKLGCGVAVFPDQATSAEELLSVVHQLAQCASWKAPVQAGGSPLAAPGRRTELVALSPRMRELVATAARIADSQLPVLIIGETGTGKEVMARLVHESSARRDKPLCCINCGAIPESLIESALFGHERGAFTGAEQRTKGIFEEANGGTVLLDEIGELSAPAQVALLRVIETKRLARVGSASEFPVDVRVLASTHRDLEEMCAAGQFRQDLLYRLNAVMLHIPPLRERVEEILPLAASFMSEAAKQNHRQVDRISPEAQQLLQNYRWPGNVRELRNVIERAVVIAQENTITVDDFSERVRRQSPASTGNGQAATGEPGDLKEQLRRYEAELLLDALRQNDWNQTKTATALNMPLRTLVHKIRTLGLRKRYDAKG